MPHAKTPPISIIRLRIGIAGGGGGIGILARAEKNLAKAKTSSDFLGFREWFSFAPGA